MALPSSVGRTSSPRRRFKRILQPLGSTFVAIDFETADRSRDSACAVSAVSVVDGEVASVYTTFIRPPEADPGAGDFEFTYIHGITPSTVRNSPSFDEIAGHLLPMLQEAPFIAAHNASFDSSVIGALCNRYGREVPLTPWLCTVRLARKTWHLPKCGLGEVSRFLGVSLNHHEAESDARACAAIVVAALSLKSPMD